MGKILISDIINKLLSLTIILFFFASIYVYNHDSILFETIKLPSLTSFIAQQTVVNAPSNQSAEFNQAVAFTLKHEGGLVDDKSDRGGITKYGISEVYLRDLLRKDPKYLSEFSLKDASELKASTIKNLTKQQAIEIYYTQWWKKYHFNELNNTAIAIKAFDYSVNMGSVPAIKLLQKACRDGADTLPPKINGQLSSSTIAYINNLNLTQENQLFYNYEKNASNYYRSIARHHPTDKKFLLGWLHRADDNSCLYA